MKLGNVVVGAGLEVLHGMPLSGLNLCESHGVEDLGGLEGLPLTWLCVPGFSNVLEDSFEVVRNMPLINLALYNGATDAALEVLRGKPMTRLEFGSGCKFTPSGLEVLRGMPLKELDAAGTSNLRGEFLRGAPLQHLHVDRFTDSDLEVVGGMGSLIDLELWDSREITDMGLEALKGLPLLRIHISGGRQITDAGLEVFRGMDSLRSVKLHNFDLITDSGLEVFLDSRLTRLQVLLCPNTTRQGAARVREACGAEMEEISSTMVYFGTGFPLF